MNSLHDYYINKYEVICSKIIIHAKHEGSKPYTNATATFSGVIGHHFEHALKGNIILSIEETENHYAFYKHSENELKRYRKYGLPVNTETAEEFVKDMEDKGLKIFEIYSSYGLSGWIFSKSCDIAITEK